MNGRILGDRYEVQQQLGKHGGRQTLLVRDIQTQELAVVKLLSFGSDFEWEHLKLFEREAETLKALSHSAIPGYLDYFELNSPDRKGFALVQTFVEGQSLEEHLKAGRTFSEAEVKQLAKALLEILIYLHGRQPPVIHRDIKPSNILLTNRSGNSVGQVYLVDFGSVQTLTAREGGTITVVGTYGYMPLEQFGGRAVPASDLYSLGATLIYLVTGTHPADLPQQDSRIQFEQLANLTPAFASWLNWMTEPSLDKRLASAGEALQTLEQPQSRESAPLVLQKPIGSKILLTKDRNHLEVLIPAAGFSYDIIPTLLFAICWNSFVLLWTVGALSGASVMNIFFALFSLPFWGEGLGMVRQVLFTVLGQVRLRLTQQQISLTYELLGFEKHRPRPAFIENISKLELECYGDHKQSIAIWVGMHKYELRAGNSITEPEIEWLANELSHWLRLPITTKHLSPQEVAQS